MFLILCDLGIVIAIAFVKDGNSQRILHLTDLIITIYFVIEVVLRIVALTSKTFFSKWDLLISVAS